MITEIISIETLIRNTRKSTKEVVDNTTEKTLITIIIKEMMKNLATTTKITGTQIATKELKSMVHTMIKLDILKTTLNTKGNILVLKMT